MIPQVSVRVVPFRNQAERRIKPKVDARVREAGNLVRRTVRAAISQPAPRIVVKEKILSASGKLTAREKYSVILGSSEPGYPPFRRRGVAYSSVGFDFRSASASLYSRGTVTIYSHGWETGRAHPRGVKRPALIPIFARNKKLVEEILAGRATAPRLGDLSVLSGRKPQKRKTERGQEIFYSSGAVGSRRAILRRR